MTSNAASTGPTPRAARLRSAKLLVCTCAGLAVMFAPSALGQSQLRPNGAGPTNGARIEAWVPVRIEALGLALEVPEGTRTTSERVGTIQATRIFPDDRAWVLEIYRLVDDPKFTAAQSADRAAARLMSSKPVPFKNTTKTVVVSDPAAGIVLRESGLKFPKAGGEAVAERFRAVLGRSERAQDDTVRDQVHIAAEAGLYIVLDFHTTRADEARTLPIFERVLRTTRLEDTAQLHRRRQANIKAGQELMRSLGNAGIEGVFKTLEEQGEQWQRLSAPSASGLEAEATELGYRRVRAGLGRRSDLGGSGSSRGNDPRGYLFSMDARMLDPTNPGGYIDVRSRFFVSVPDEEGLTSEEWVIEGLQYPRPGARPLVSRELGTREGAGILVVRQTPTEPREELSIMIEGDGYLPQVLRYVLPQLLAANQSSIDAAFYTYMPEFSTNRLRTDSAERKADGSWTVRTWLGDDEPAFTTELDASGQARSTTLSDGRVWTATTPKALLELWNRKGLPTGK